MRFQDESGAETAPRHRAGAFNFLRSPATRRAGGGTEPSPEPSSLPAVLSRIQTDRAELVILTNHEADA